MQQPIRVRFAPSPTGALHIGGIRTALYNYLFAKKHNGTFILRIEDTDKNRYVQGAENYIIEALDWCGIPYDEGPGKDGGYGPYRQSERGALYTRHVQELIASGNAYYAFDTPDSLTRIRLDHETQGKTFIYNWHNRLQLDNSLTLTAEQTQEKLKKSDYVVRFKCPKDKKLILYDTIRGQITFASNLLDDKVLYKSDGMPTYHLANIVDDHLMEISHVIRGEEWLPSLPLHHLIYDAFGWSPPQFAHLPLILKPSGKGKLSKRDGEKMGFPVFPLSWEAATGYRESGYLPEALCNFLALLGWNPGTEQEIFSLQELIDQFTLERVHKSGARFDIEKAKWYNHHYLQHIPNEALAEAFLPIAQSHLSHYPKDQICSDVTKSLTENKLPRIISLLKERATFTSDFWELADYFFVRPQTYEHSAVTKFWKSETPELMHQLSSLLENNSDFTAIPLEHQLKLWIAEHELASGKVVPPLRLVLVGKMKGPHLFDILELLGKEESLLRINLAIEKLQSH